jgi:hypothetical protein
LSGTALHWSEWDFAIVNLGAYEQVVVATWINEPKPTFLPGGGPHFLSPFFVHDCLFIATTDASRIMKTDFQKWAPPASSGFL